MSTASSNTPRDRDIRSAFSTHRRNISVPTTSSSMMITPPLSPPSFGAPGTPASTMSALRRPTPAHLNLAAVSSTYSQPVVNNRYSQPPPRRPSNPYEFAQYESQRYNPSANPPPDAFDIHSTPASPVSPVLHPAYPLAAAGDESLFDRWLRHEEMGRPIFPGSRTGSSVATSDISSVRGGMFGSLPGGRATGPSSRRGPGSVASAATRDRDNFTSSAPSYPSSRAGASRPASRDGDATSVNGESYPPSVISSDVYPPSIDARLQYVHAAPPFAPTPPRSYISHQSSEVASTTGSTVYRIETVTSSIVTIPEGAATRPPRYSDSLPAPPYQLPLADLINNGTVGYQGLPMMTYGAPTAAAEKAALAAAFENPAAPGQTEGGVVMVRQEVWEELRRRAGLDGGIPNIPAPENYINMPVGASESLNRQVIKQRIGKSDEDVRCCGACIIC